MPIRDENRLIVAFGLRRIEHSQRVGLCALIDAVGKRPDGSRSPRAQRITSGFIGYTLAPRINAAGRISSAGLAVELFLTDSRDKADALAKRLCDINRERQTEENRIATEAYAEIDATHDFANDPVIVLAADNWHHGVIGIVASRITEKYGLPSILISFDGAQSDGDCDVGKGSGRSVKGLNLVDALVYCDDLLEKYGGHELAAGLSVRRENIDAFRKKINEYAREHFKAEDRTPSIDADFEIGIDEVTLENAEEIRMLEPFGVSNPVPSFVLRNVTVADVQPISFGKHTKLLLERPGAAPLTAMYFSHSPKEADVYPGDRIDILAGLDINEFGGKRTAQLILRDLRLTADAAAAAEESAARYAALRAGEPAPGADIVPSREDFGAVYNFIRRQVRFGEDSFTVREMLMRDEHVGAVGYIKLRFIIDVLYELNIVGVESLGGEAYRFRVSYQQKRADLDKSAILRRLRTQTRAE